MYIDEEDKVENSQDVDKNNGHKKKYRRYKKSKQNK